MYITKSYWSPNSSLQWFAGNTSSAINVTGTVRINGQIITPVEAWDIPPRTRPEPIKTKKVGKPIKETVVEEIDFGPIKITKRHLEF